eukprot:CAMPEP_0170507094 /NCGR_PEP_ID=MMETSP0208-20121228/57640_1 /TAXON_ID=197538 /ORGANISM="Strombidium inclinatum, Strain S3" /LENGTH=67 /DNA_ID=CAMNT_0010789085 /DNA_START=68 /DNA_END=271 /DNA_ORIENTATION=+
MGPTEKSVDQLVVWLKVGLQVNALVLVLGRRLLETPPFQFLLADFPAALLHGKLLEDKGDHLGGVSF